jgi:hypothetical protein
MARILLFKMNKWEYQVRTPVSACYMQCPCQLSNAHGTSKDSSYYLLVRYKTFHGIHITTVAFEELVIDNYHNC